MISSLMSARPERNGQCQIADVIELHRAGADEQYFNALPDMFTCRERVEAFKRLMPIEYAQAFAQVRQRTAAPEINGKSVIEFWMAENPKHILIGRQLSPGNSNQAITLEAVAEKIRKGRLQSADKPAYKDILRSVWSALPALPARDPARIADYINAVKSRTYVAGLTPDAVQAYRYLQLGIDAARILQPPPPTGAEHILITYPASDHNGAFYNSEAINHNHLSQNVLRRYGQPVNIAVVKSPEEYCTALQHYANAHIVVAKAHGETQSQTLSARWTGDGATVLLTTNHDLSQCYSKTAPGAAIVYDSCSTGGDAALAPGKKNLLQRCAEDAPGRRCVGAAETASDGTITSWNPFQVRFYACEIRGNDTTKCMQTRRDVTRTAYRPAGKKD